MADVVFYSEVCAMLGDKRQRFIYKSGGKRRGNCIHKTELQAHG